jgi:hypothetical protein
VSGVAIFSEKNAGGITISEAGVPLAPAAQAFRLYAEASGDASQIQTGIALANSAATAATVTVELYKLSGVSTGLKGPIFVPANGQVQMFLSQIPGFANLPTPFRGVLRISTTSSVGLNVVGLRTRVNERGEFLITTTVPVNENTFSGSQAWGPLFPHLADGGGFTTQIVLFSGSAGQAASGIIEFSSQTGQPLNFTFQ